MYLRFCKLPVLKWNQTLSFPLEKNKTPPGVIRVPKPLKMTIKKTFKKLLMKAKLILVETCFRKKQQHPQQPILTDVPHSECHFCTDNHQSASLKQIIPIDLHLT